jgi:4-hydroxy-3-polyprenylbenzoate decarboxylase
MSTTEDIETISQTETKPITRMYRGDGKNVILAITGTSGAIYGLRMLRTLIINDFNIDLILTEYANYTLYRECGVELKQNTIQSIFPEIMIHKSQIKFHNNLDIKSEIFLETYNIFGMIISPCSTDYLSGIANGSSRNLIEKAADWILSNNKTLILIPRETPVNKIYLKNMLSILEAGGFLVPAMPAYDNSPKDFNDLGDYIAEKTMSILMRGETLSI